jgi:CheY-like chemotaxis protein
MIKVLLVVRDPMLGNALAIGMEYHFGALVTRAMTGTLGAEALEHERLDLAVVDVFLPDISGFELAETAANRNIPVLLATGDAEVEAKLREHGYPYLANSVIFDDLPYQAAVIMTDPAENVQAVKVSAAKLRAAADALVSSSRRQQVQAKSWVRGRRLSSGGRARAGGRPSASPVGRG